MTETRIRLTALAVAILAGDALYGCGAPTPAQRFHPESDGAGVAVGGDDATGGATPTGVGGAGAAGSGGAGGGSGTGGVGGSGGGGAGGGGSAGGSGGAFGETADASAGIGGAGDSGSGGTGASATGGSGGAGGTGGARDAGSDMRPEAGFAVPGDGTTAACFTDPAVIAICKQLEPACMNCPDGSIWNECFNVAAAGDDRACARYAVTNKCTVDPGGNTCGSLNCRASGCNRAACTAAQGEGDTTVCEPLLKTCPCK